jgi:hypothetical protein
VRRRRKLNPRLLELLPLMLASDFVITTEGRSLLLASSATAAALKPRPSA